MHSLEDGKYSILDELNDNLRYDGKFEFILEYPDEDNNPGMNRWTQSNSPLQETEINGQAVKGFKPISITWGNAHADNGDSWPFNGLALSKSGKTILDGANPSEIFYFAIGLYSVYQTNCLPGYNEHNKEVILWVRVPDRHQQKCTHHNPMLIGISLALISLLSS